MNKCIGCGSILQDTIENKDGYVLDINDKLVVYKKNIKSKKSSVLE